MRARFHPDDGLMFLFDFNIHDSKETLDMLNAALAAVRRDLMPRVEELARKSSAGTLTPEEQGEYAEIVRLNDTLSVLELQAEELSAVPAAS
jgi:hypothetical protein